MNPLKERQTITYNLKIIALIHEEIDKEESKPEYDIDKIIECWQDIKTLRKEVRRLKAKLGVPLLDLYLIRHHKQTQGNNRKTLNQIAFFAIGVFTLFLLTGIVTIFVQSNALNIVTYVLMSLCLIIGIWSLLLKIKER